MVQSVRLVVVIPARAAKLTVRSLGSNTRRSYPAVEPGAQQGPAHTWRHSPRVLESGANLGQQVFLGEGIGRIAGRLRLQGRLGNGQLSQPSQQQPGIPCVQRWVRRCIAGDRRAPGLPQMPQTSTLDNLLGREVGESIC